MSLQLSDRMVVLSGNSNRSLASDICAELGLEPGRADVTRFPDGEISVTLGEDVRGKDVFVVQSTCPPVNENLMELLVMIDCVKRSSAARITAVIPYFGYARQDRREQGARVPITAKMVANLIVAAGADRVVTMDLHCEQIQGFFDIPVDHVYAGSIIIDHYAQKNLSDLVVVSPDVGAIKMARAYSRGLGARLATVDKRRVSGEKTEIGFIIGDVAGLHAILADDVIATGGSITAAAELILQKGAKSVFLACTHPVLCGPAVERLQASPAQEIAVVDTIPVDGKISGDRVALLSCASAFANSIRQIHKSASIGRNNL
ncbi:MAG: ribose-phosphate pyrophosphokinase [Planctomycetota bacterium]|jgi:ribose-phosphate pyrophosphokinase|nr:ribose-phosphate pyrophosphokinase [Planctomycetota bacterium]